MSDFNRFYVYMHRFKNGCLYVGKGSKNRYKQMFLGRHNTYWDRLFKKYGAPKARILKNGMSENDSLILEVSIIARLKDKRKKLCNLTSGGNGCLGLSVSDDTRKKLSKALSGKNNVMFGKKQTDRVKSLISEANKGRFIGSKSSRYKHDKFDFIHKDGSVFSGTQWSFCKKYNLSQSHVSMVCSGNQDSVKGWRLSSTLPSETGRTGKRHGRYDHTIFKFKHDSGITEECTKNDLLIKYNLPHASNLSNLCSGKIPSYKGWRLVRD